MAYGRKRNSRFRSRRSFKSRRGSVRRSSYRGVARVVRRVLNRQIEKKYSDYESGTQLGSWNGWQKSIPSVITQGDGDQGKRIGNKIMLKGLGVRGILSGNPNSTYQFQSFRVVVYRSHNDLGVEPSLTSDIFSPDISASERWLGPYNFQKSKKYTILADNRYNMAATNGSEASPAGWKDMHRYERFIKLNHICQFDKDNLIMDGDVYVAVVSDIDPSNAAKPAFRIITRLYYQDA